MIIPPIIVRTFSLYEKFFTDEQGGLHPNPKTYCHPSFPGSSTMEQLEHYRFYQSREDAPYEIAIQSGVAGSGGYGGERRDILPQTWFAGSWDEFLDHFLAAYPADVWFLTRDELAHFPGLRQFLGFGQE